MADWVYIANKALRLVGSDQIQDPNETSEAARAVLSVRDAIVDEVLTEHPWNCAQQRAQLAAAGDAPLWGFTYKFLLPADPFCLRVLWLEDVDLKWKVEGRYLLCDAAGPLNILYLKRIADPQEFSPWVANLIAHRIAEAIAFRLTQSNSVDERVEKKLLIAERRARTADAQEGTAEELLPDEFLASRY